MFDFAQNLNLLSCFFIVGSFDLFVKIFDSVVHIFEILKNELGVDDLHVSDGVDGVLGVGDVLIFESSDDVINTVDLLDVAQEMVTQTLTLGCASHQTGNINDLKNCSYFRLWSPHLAKFVESFIGYWDDSFVWLDGAERIIFGRYVELGEDIVSG